MDQSVIMVCMFVLLWKGQGKWVIFQANCLVWSCFTPSAPCSSSTFHGLCTTFLTEAYDKQKTPKLLFCSISQIRAFALVTDIVKGKLMGHKSVFSRQTVVSWTRIWHSNLSKKHSLAKNFTYANIRNYRFLLKRCIFCEIWTSYSCLAQ